jgi:hypothetical protein
MPLEDFIITVFCLVSDLVKNTPELHNLRSRGFPPKLSDEEVMTIEIVGEFLGIDTDKGLWSYSKSHWLHLFPNIGARSTFAKHCANLWRTKQIIQVKVARLLNATNDKLHIADGFPIPICKLKRAYYSSIFKGKANYGYCASKSESYYGFKGNLMINSEGVVSGITVTAANVDERESLWDIIDNIDGLILADKGLIGEDYQRQLAVHANVNLQTPMRDNMNDTRGKDAGSWLVSTRRLVETVIGQLSDQFHIQKVKARDIWHLTSRIARKILAHTVAVFVNKMLGNKPLQLEKVISV